MMSIVRSLAGGFAHGMPGPAVARLGVQSVAAMSSRSWVVQHYTPIVTSLVPLGQRQVAIVKPEDGGRAEGAIPSGPVAPSEAAQPPAKQALEIRFTLKDGREALVRRAEASDMKALATFMEQSFIGGTPAQGSNHAEKAAQEHLWMAKAPNYDAVVAVVDGRIVGTAHIDPLTHELAPQKNEHFLNAHGVRSGEVCVGHLTVLREAQDQGIGTVLHKATAIAATQAGYQGVTQEASDPKTKAIVKKLGGSVQDNAVLGPTLLRGDSKGVKSE